MLYYFNILLFHKLPTSHLIFLAWVYIHLVLCLSLSHYTRFKVVWAFFFHLVILIRERMKRTKTEGTKTNVLQISALHITAHKKPKQTFSLYGIQNHFQFMNFHCTFKVHLHPLRVLLDETTVKYRSKPIWMQVMWLVLYSLHCRPIFHEHKPFWEANMAAVWWLWPEFWVLNDCEMITLKYFDCKLRLSFAETNDSHIMLFQTAVGNQQPQRWEISTLTMFCALTTNPFRTYFKLHMVALFGKKKPYNNHINLLWTFHSFWSVV